jgi:hypothetical protein
VLLLLLVANTVAHATEPPAPGPTRIPSEASSTAGDSVSAEELARRLQHLEQQNAKLTLQNNKLAEQNANLAAQSQSLSGKLDTITKRFDQLPFPAANSAPGAALLPPQPSAHVNPPSFRAVFQPVRIIGDNAPIVDSPALDARRPAGVLSLPDVSTFQAETGPKSEARESDSSAKSEPSQTDKSASTQTSRFIIGGYDEELGQFILVRPRDAQKVPFELRADVFTQARYTYFGPSASSYTDSTGTAMPIQRISSIEIMRNFVQLSGYAIDPRLQFTVILFSSTAINDTVYLGWLSYRFSDALEVRVGNWLVPGTREWYTSFRYTLGADRTMATTFFRPNISPGIWAQGEPIENVHYVAMVANSLNRFNQGIDRIGSSVAFGGSAWWEPLGAFGVGPSDVENSQTPLTRLGLNLAVSRESNQGITDERLPNPEDTIIRLSDGTPLFRPGALGPGVSLTGTNVQLWTMDAAFKYRGMSVSGEYFLRWLDGFSTAGCRPSLSSIFDHGALLQSSYFVIPTKLEPYVRSSFVNGPFGSGSEYGAGINWYPTGSRNWRFTCEAVYLNRCPADNLITGYRAGESGTLFQFQWFTDF